VQYRVKTNHNEESIMFKINKTSTAIALIAGLLALPATIMAHNDDDKSYVLSGNCAQLPATRTTEFHGNLATSNLNLAMAGNQWNAMYQRMDEYTRLNGSPAEVAALDSLLAAVAVPQPGSPAATRTGIITDFNLATNAACHYTGHATITDGTLRLCEFAVLNKANTHETRVHHVETPTRILAGESDVGPVWASELQLAVNNGSAVSGLKPIDAVNRPVVYSVAFLATMSNKHKNLARKWVNFLHSPEDVKVYTDGGFLPLTGTEPGERYSFDAAGNLVIDPFTP